MMKKIKNMKKNTVVSIAIVLVFAILLTSGAAVFNWSGAATQKKTATTKVKKPGQVKGLKKVKVSPKWNGRRRVVSAKIKFNKVKGAAGYQVLIYQKKHFSDPDLMTTIVWAKNTKKTTYTIQNLVPSEIYTIKVRAYKKDKKGKVIYGKARSIKVKTTGLGGLKGCYYLCDTCTAVMPANNYLMWDHTESAYKLHKETHAGGTFNTYK